MKVLGKKVLCVIAAGLISFSAFAQETLEESDWSEFDDGFSIDLDEDLSEAISEEPVENTGSGKMANVLQGIWIETTSKTNAIIRDIATGEKSGYEIDNQHFASNANWWFWGDITKTFHLDAEIGVWNFDKVLYQADSFGSNIPSVTWGDGFQSLFAMIFSPFYNWNDNSVGAFNKLGFGINTPYINVKLGYGSLKENGMASFSGIYNVIDQWLDVGKGFTEISNGKKLQKFGDVKLNTIAAFSMMRGTYGLYDILDAKFGESYRAVATFGSKTNAEQLFYYNTDNLNAASLYFMANPLNALTFEAHGISTFGTGLAFDSSVLAAALRFTYKNDSLEMALKGSYAGDKVNSVWGSDGQSYDDINADTITSKLDFSWQAKDFISLGLDETLTFNDVDALSDGLLNIRTQPLIDFYFEPLTELDMNASLYGVFNVDRLDTASSAGREIVFSFAEAGIEFTANNLAPSLKKLTFDYAITFDYEEWEEGNSYDVGVSYNSLMFTADITDNLNIHAGSIIRTKSEDDPTFVPVGFALGSKFASIPLPGRPSFWWHFCYGMNPYSENNYSLYRADNWMNKAAHRTYLLNDLYEDYTSSQIALGLIWNIQ
ncbi:MAG: hypothetical protein K5829_02760 [Treponema sp.]|nr:hypothetical protein [Treponema sp.]